MPPVGASQPTAEHARPFSHARKLSENDRVELEKLERAVSRMQKHTRPDPYIVTIAQDEDLRYQYQWRSQQYQWLHGAPFRYEEGEGIQYQTFVFQEPGTNMLSLHAQHYPEERPGTADSTRNATGSNTPAQGPKKVISFGAYKKKQSGETPAQENLNGRDADKSGKQPAVKGPAERVKQLEAESADMIKAVEEDEKVEAIRDVLSQTEAPGDKGAAGKQPELKRKREEHTTVTKDKSRTNDVNGNYSPPPVKKARTEATATTSKEKRRPGSPSAANAKRVSNKQDVEPDTHMPPRLSPLRIEPRASDFFELPPRLSPELPPNIDAALKATDAKRTINRGHDDRRDGRRALGTKAPATSNDKSPQVHDNRRARSKSPDSSANHRSTGVEHHAQLPQQLSDGQDAVTNKKQKALVIKLKFRKARKEDVQRILKLPARPDKHATTESSDDEDTAELESSHKEAVSRAVEKADDTRRSGKGVAQKIGPLSRKVEEKRPTSEKRPRHDANTDDLDDVEPPPKKKRVDDAAPEQSNRKKAGESAASQHPSTKKQVPNALDLKKTPSTPVPPAVPSPAVSSVQKATPATRRDLLHPRREASTDSQTETPPALSNTPSEQKRSSQQNGSISRPPSSNPQSGKPATAQAWETERLRLEKLGRDLKHGASDLLNNKPNSTARRLAAAKSLESLLCYLLAFTCCDRAALVANQNVQMRPWRSLPPFCAFVSRATQDFGTLSGLASGLTVVVYSRIFDIASQYPSEAPSRDSFIELSGALRKAATHAEEHLDVDAVTRAFPKSWAGRAKTSLAALSPSEFGEPKRLLQGGYRLPFGVQTDPLQAARAGLALVKEWIAKEGLDYDFKLAA